MRLKRLHPWDLTPSQATALQRELASQVVRTGAPKNVHFVAGADVAFPERTRGWTGGVARAAVIVLSYPEFEIVEQHVTETPVAFPYVPGLLSFREVPALSLVLERLKSKPDLLLADGHGVAHPRRFGFASHLGLLAGIPTIGCAKSILCGGAGVPGDERGSTADLIDKGERVAIVLRTKTRVRPVYVSVGHNISLEAAADWVLRLAPTHRLPEPIRLADRLSKALPLGKL
jgi:deoxyribonuclease V